jgi:hypothetical protein
MTEHKATSGQWEALEEHSWQDAYSCILELRARMGALEDAQRPTVKDSLTVPADSLTGRQPWAAMRFRGVTLLPPIDCADPDSWIADRIYEMGLADGKNATTGNTAPVTRDRADDRQRWMERQLEKPDSSLVERVAIVCAMPAKRTWDDQARAAILAVADWSEQQGLRTAADWLRMEVRG